MNGSDRLFLIGELTTAKEVIERAELRLTTLETMASVHARSKRMRSHCFSLLMVEYVLVCCGRVDIPGLAGRIPGREMCRFGLRAAAPLSQRLVM